MKLPACITCTIAVTAALAVPAAADASWGAIAVNTSNGSSSGIAGAPTKSAAKSAALSRCMGSCRVLATVKRGCAAVATKNGRYRAGKASSLSRAKRSAKRRAGRGSRTISTVCNR